MRFNRCRGAIACSFVSGSSGSPENRTQRYAVISRVWATSPRLPFPVGHPGVEPPAADAANSQHGSCSQSRRASICTSARVSPVRTAGFEPAISRSPGPPAGTPRDPRLRHVLIKYPVGESNPNPTGIRSPSADPLDRARCARTSSAVGWEVLEPSSPALQTGATPSQLPAQQKKPGVLVTPGFGKSPATSRAECHKRQWRTGRVLAG